MLVDRNTEKAHGSDKVFLDIPVITRRMVLKYEGGDCGIADGQLKFRIKQTEDSEGLGALLKRC
jgi:hypothetical protein